MPMGYFYNDFITSSTSGSIRIPGNGTPPILIRPMEPPITVTLSSSNVDLSDYYNELMKTYNDELIYNELMKKDNDELIRIYGNAFDNFYCEKRIFSIKEDDPDEATENDGLDEFLRSFKIIPE